MSETKQGHTPGPWRTGSINYADIFADDEPVALVVKHFNDDNTAAARTIANARLIAAAPDLLAALEEIVAMAQPTGSTDWEDYRKLGCVGDIARAAVAKAKGDA